MSPSLPDHVLAQAPRRWVSLGNGMRVKVIDPDWRKQQEAIAELRQFAQTLKPRVNTEDAFRSWAIRCLAVDAPIHTEQGRESFAAVADDVLEYHADVTLSEIRGQSRRPHIIVARHHLIYEAFRRCHLTLPTLGRMIGDRDHSTILHAIREWPRKAAKLGIHVQPLGRERSGE